MLEYLYLGKAVLVTAVNAVGEIIEPGINGWIFDGRDYRRLAHLILALCRDQEKRNALSRNSALLYQGKYSETVFYGQYVNVVQDVYNRFQ